MRVPLSWLHEYVDFDLSADELVDLFSLRSQEIDGVYRLGVMGGEVVVGEVIEFGPHPNADRLYLSRRSTSGAGRYRSWLAPRTLTPAPACPSCFLAA